MISYSIEPQTMKYIKGYRFSSLGRNIRKINAEKVVKPKVMPDDNSKNVEEINIPSEIREEIVSELKAHPQV